MVELFHLINLMVVEMMLVTIVVDLDFEKFVHQMIQQMNYCLYLHEKMMIMFVLIEVLLHYLQNIQLEQIKDIEMMVMYLY